MCGQFRFGGRGAHATGTLSGTPATISASRVPPSCEFPEERKCWRRRPRVPAADSSLLGLLSVASGLRVAIAAGAPALVLAEPLRLLAQFLGLANELVSPAWVRVEVRLEPQQQALVDERLDVVRPQLQRAFDGFESLCGHLQLARGRQLEVAEGLVPVVRPNRIEGLRIRGLDRRALFERRNRFYRCCAGSS